jgi:hypothetical protein
LWVSPSGLLSQVVSVSKPFEGIERHYVYHQAQIGMREVTNVMRLAERVGFAKLRSKYESEMTDCCTERIALRLGNELKVVEACGDRPEGFEELWLRIHRYAPIVNSFHPWWSRGRTAAMLGWWFCRRTN